MAQVNIYEAKTQLSKLIERATAGEDIVIARAGHPLVRLVPVGEPGAPRRLGALRGKIWMSDDWDRPETNAEIARMFEESELEPPG